MGWETEEFGSSHVGVAGAVLPDGTEPKPAFIDNPHGNVHHFRAEHRVLLGWEHRIGQDGECVQLIAHAR
ncbi:hypothetical protein BLA24_08105 [Streptomyces cinnamoneus]|uniref:Uncharacterized protein n=1 Tax=Streptomyces cinnamoneus TaxID=53446 RepID=A0A2G1XMB5_STRCJ|nr:hypothetical protein BLA24_08105 [Streptomyces cinnamoneus]PPT11596.1 hypothetical protein CYQ11_00545 [Streptomyces cinnamoneus]